MTDNHSAVCSVAVKWATGGWVSKNDSGITLVAIISSSVRSSTTAHVSGGGCSRLVVHNGTPALAIIITAHAVATPLCTGSRALRQLGSHISPIC